MPLVTCPDCHTQASDRARECPKCGRPIPTIWYRRPIGGPVFFLLVFGALSFAWPGFILLAAIAGILLVARLAA